MNPTEIVNSIAPTGAPSAKRGGALRRFFDIWGDPEKRDTSGWNVYYYYYRQIAQHTAAISLKRMKWIAILFQLYFFLHMLLPIIASIYRGELLLTPFQNIVVLGLIVPPMLLMIVSFLIPTIMIGNAFKLTLTGRGLMTSRAKEPPLLAHLSQYTSNSGLVVGAIQSLIYTWCRFMLYLLPSILALVALWIYSLLVIAPYGNDLESGWAIALWVRVFHLLAFDVRWFLPCLLVFLATTSVFFTMQFLCYRLDTLALMIFLGAFAISIVMLQFGNALFKGTSGDTAWVPLVDYVTSMFIPACLIGIAYFPLAAADTMDYGLGKASRWLRALQVLMAAVGVYAFVLFGNLTPESAKGTRLSLSSVNRMVFIWALLGVSGLLADSLALASPRAKNLCRLHASRSFPRRCFDPSSPWSLLPIVLLEWLLILFTVGLLGEYHHAYGSFAKDIMVNPGLTPFRYLWRDLMSPDNVYVRVYIELGSEVWGVIHFALAVMFRLRRNNPQMKPACKFFVQYNLIVMVSLFIGYIFLGGLLRKPVWFIVFYVVSLIVLFAVARDREPSARKKKESVRA